MSEKEGEGFRDQGMKYCMPLSIYKCMNCNNYRYVAMVIIVSMATGYWYHYKETLVTSY